MGLLDSTVGRIGAAALTGGTSEIYRAAIHKANDAVNGPGNPANEAPQVPALDPRIKQMAEQQYKQAQDFQNQAGDYKQRLGNQAKEVSNMGLANTTSNINKSANSRGLLYSGIRQGAQAGAQGQAAAGLAKQQAGINEGVDNQAAALRNQALQTQMGVSSLEQQRGALANNVATAKENQKGMLGGLLDKVSSII